MTEYWYLFAMLFVIVLLISFDPASKAAGGSRNLTPAQVPQLQSREQTVIVDLNESEKFKLGHITQSINVPFSTLSDSLGKLKKHQKKSLILVCENGNNSKKAVTTLKNNEFPNIYVLAGGLTAWKKENFPLEKS